MVSGMGCGSGGWYGSHGRQPWTLNESTNVRLVSLLDSRSSTSERDREREREKREPRKETFSDIFPNAQRLLHEIFIVVRTGDMVPTTQTEKMQY